MEKLVSGKHAPRDSVVEVSACEHEHVVRLAVKDSGPDDTTTFPATTQGDTLNP